MRKLVLGFLGAAALTVGTSANATILTDPIDGPTLESFGSDMFGNNRDAAEGTGSFTDVFNFTLSAAWDANAEISTIILRSKDIDFSSILLDGFGFDQVGFDPNTEVWQLDVSSLAAGPHSVTVNGSISGPGGGAYSGTINVAPPVPEPATWAMMLLGFGAIGYAMRRRRRPALMQVA